MRALFSRFQRGVTKDKEKDKESPKDKDGADPPLLHKEKIPSLPPLPEWPPSQRPMSTPTSLASFKPLPDLSERPLPPIDEPSSPLSTQSSATQTPPTHHAPSLRTQHSSGARSTADHPSSPSVDQDSSGRNSRKTTNGSVNTVHTTSGASETPKKVAFISPPPTPAPDMQPIDRALDVTPTATAPSTSSVPAGVPNKTSVSRFQAAHGKDPRGSTSTAASTSKVEAPPMPKAPPASMKTASTRTALSPHPQKMLPDALSLNQSMRSGTPYSQMSQNSSRIVAAASWSEVAEEDLVSNLGHRERTRQEVLWEIVASEERYVTELIKMKDTFVEPLLHPLNSASSPMSYTPLQEYDDYPSPESPTGSVDQLPIAARFMSPIGFRSETPAPPTPSVHTGREGKDKDTPNIDDEMLDTDDDELDDRMGKGYPSSRRTGAMSQASKHSHPRSPYRSAASSKPGAKNAVAFPSRSHQSLPPPPRSQQMSSSTHSLGRQSILEQREREARERNVSNGYASAAERKATSPQGQGSRVLRKPKKSQNNDNVWGDAVPPHQLPEDLRICLEVIESGILDGHMRLSEGLRRRYDEQYPLVRSLADVFVSNSHIFSGYATYVLHLERALEQVDSALSTASAAKKPKDQDSVAWLKVCKYLQKLEMTAADKGETGLAITLSKPFQRLLKYPLLFQNLLFHTDPSTFEYESTLQMVAEVETIVRSIEDEKIQKEERDKTRDVFARIEGLDKVRQLAMPKPSRVLIEELVIIGVNPQNGTPKTAPAPPIVTPPKGGVKGKSSFKRLSDVLQSGTGVGGKKDLWLVVFNDVALRCQRTGTTSLPLVSSTNSRTTSLPDLQGKAKYATTGRRTSHTKPRNLYKFIKIETWAIGGVIQPREGVVSMEDVVRSRNQVHSGIQPKIVPMPDEDEEGDNDSDDSDRKSKMSFSYWGADKVTIQKPIVKTRPTGTATRRGSPMGPSYGRESSANAKFGSRMVADFSAPNSARPSSRRTQNTPISRRNGPSSDEAKAAANRPAWDTSTRTTVGQPTAPALSKRTRNTSQTSAATRTTAATAATKQLASPAPSEDSGVGLYRQIIAQDPSLNRD